MPDTTPNLALPFILPSQAQKHVTHNEALQQLDAVVQLAVTGSGTTPPADPAEGECWIVEAGATGAWLGQDGKLAARRDAAWAFIVPQPGWFAWFLDLSGQRIFDGSTWISPLQDDAIRRVGINTSADDTNRLAVASDASLLTHAGDDHRLKINKATEAATASILLQSAWSGRAEIGLTGSDELRIKVSGDGSTWRDSLAISSSGVVRQPHRPLVKATFADTVPAPAAGVATGFEAFGLVQGGFSLGAAVPLGAGNRLVVPEDGSYLVCLTIEALSVTGSFRATALAHGSGTSEIAAISAAAPGKMTAAGLLFLQSGDTIDVEHEGTATFDFSAEASHLILALVG